MIFDIKDAFLIAGGLIFTVFFFVDYLTKNDLLDDEPCTRVTRSAFQWGKSRHKISLNYKSVTPKSTVMPTQCNG
jgi:hypothetical protein